MTLSVKSRRICAHTRRQSPLRLECLEDRVTPATFNVNTTLDVLDAADGKRSLREAITAANNLAGADVIVVPASVFKITILGGGEDANATGDFDISDTLTIQGAGKGTTFIDGQQLDRVFDVIGTAPSSIKVILQGMTIRNGNATGLGGGIQVGDADLVVRDCVVSGNRSSESGGGIANVPGTANVKLVRSTVGRNVAASSGGGISTAGISVLTVKDTTIRRNIAGVHGGGVFADTAMLVNSTVSGNTATSAGGGIWVSDTATLTGSTVSGNAAGSNGGGINAFTTTLTNTTVSNNTAGTDGGGIDANTATLTNCTVSGNTTADFGGGVSANTATLTKCTVSGNFASDEGGGIQASTANLTISTVSGNSASIEGGGIRAGTANLNNCTVSGNRVTGEGGGIDAVTATLTNCTVSGNTSTSNGGGIDAATTATLTNCTVSGNSAGTDGGGIRAGNVTLINSTVSGNTSGNDGGGIRAGTATLTNSTVSGNTSGNRGGGIFVSIASLLNCTIVENIAQTGGGLFLNPGGTFNVRNTIVALNLVGFSGAGPDVSGDFTSGGHNLIGDTTGGTGFTNGVNGDMVGTSANPIDPKLGPLANNGGRTKTHAPKAGSLAIDHGDNTGVTATDQRGLPRKKDGNGDGLAIVDIGAFEK